MLAEFYDAGSSQGENYFEEPMSLSFADKDTNLLREGLDGSPFTDASEINFYDYRVANFVSLMKERL